MSLALVLDEPARSKYALIRHNKTVSHSKALYTYLCICLVLYFLHVKRASDLVNLNLSRINAGPPTLSYPTLPYPTLSYPTLDDDDDTYI